jgi:5-amino-6-(5-phospho-D-ribitylamino)uracil phosphatase
MKYKALILDVDGTTVANAHDARPTKRMIEAIKNAQEHLHVCFATGRPLYRVQDLIEELQLTSPCVLTGGTQIYDPVTKSFLLEQPLDPAVLSTVYPLFQTYAPKFYYQQGESHEEWKGQTDIHPLVIFTDGMEPDAADQLHKQLLKINGVNSFKMVAWEQGKVCVDMVDQAASKLHGISFLQNHLGITKEELIGVGDGYNDFPLLMACGLKFAMGNAVDELKEIADFICPPVSEDGVATIIEKFILAKL